MVATKNKMAALHDREAARGNANRATISVARKLTAYLLAVDRRGTPFAPSDESQAA